ncbi:MAG: PIG-L deacetylase family protein [Marinobacter sp.]|uniref:PIG-L deacetylase family protein n=1 Tax=Marinobacter sp. TaxID=50741 RepID=UPI0032978B11
MERIAAAQQTNHLIRHPTLTPAKPQRNDGAIPLTSLGPILIASPHPDDETLGCGGLIARCAKLACSITVLAMTNGEASHPGDRVWQEKLGNIRKNEQYSALKMLGIAEPDVVSLGLPDGGLELLGEEQCELIEARILELMQAREIRTVFVPAVDDCHSDHRVTARLLAAVALSHPVEYFFSYQIWPPEERSPWVVASEYEYLLDITDLISLKREAVYQHRSQLNAIDPVHNEGFRMPEALLEAKLKNQESFAWIRDISAWSQ